MKPKCMLSGGLVGVAFSSIFFCSSAVAADIYWDTNGSTAGSGNANGNWDAATANWTTSSSGSAATQVWAGGGDTAIFAAGTDFIGTHTITVAGTQALAGITVPVPASGTTSLTLSGTGSKLDFGASTGVINTSALGQGASTTAHVVTISSNLLGTGGLILNANGNTAAGNGAGAGGRLGLNGDNTNLSGGISITGGLVDAGTGAAFGLNTITLSNGGGILDASHNVILPNDIVLSTGGGTIRTYGSTTTIFSGAISGTTGLTHTDSGTAILNGTNSYTGATTIAGGFLQVNSIGTVFSSSSGLGGPGGDVTNATITMGSAAALGGLIYAGPGETTDRVLNFVSGNGGTVTQNGAGLLAFSSPMTLTNSAMLVTLSGAGSGEMTSFTGNTSALLNINKAGIGTWTVTGNITPNGGAIRPQLGVLVFSPTATTTGTAALTSGRVAGGVVQFENGSSIITSSTNTNGILGGWAVFAGTDWAQANGSTAVTAYSGGYVADAWSATSNTNVTVAGTDPASGSTTNSLRFNDSSGAKTLTLTGTNALTTGGILVTSNVGGNVTTIGGGGTLTTSNLNKIAGDLVVFQNNPSADVTISSLISNAVIPSQTANFATGQKVVTGLTSTANLYVGMAVSGTGIAANSTISTIDSATQITLNNNTSAPGTAVSLTFTSVNGLTKAGPGRLNLISANTYTGVTNVLDGVLSVDAKSGAGVYALSNKATFYMGYAVPSSYNFGVTVNGAGTSATTGLYLKGGNSVNAQGSGGITLASAPTTVRTYGTGNAILSGWDSNGYCITVNREASGSILSPTISFTHGTYGYRMNVLAGAQNATGDVTFQGVLDGAGNQQQTQNGIQTNYYKWGNGSLLLTGASTATTGLWVREGALIIGADDRWSPNSNGIALGDGTTVAKIILNGHSQTLKDLATNNASTGSRVVGGSATLSNLTLGYSGTGRTFDGVLGGTGANENNFTLTKSGTGLVTLTGANTYDGGTVVLAGTLGLGSTQALGTTGTVYMSGGNLQLTAANSDPMVGGRIVFADNAISGYDTNGLTVTLSQTLPTGVMGTAGLRKLGTGTLIIAEAQAFSGSTVLSAGVLNLDYATSDYSKLSDTGTLTLAGGTLRLSGGTHVEVVGNTVVSGAVTIERTSGSAKIELSDISRSGTGSLDIAAPNIARTTLSNDGSGKLPSWITVAGQPASNDGAGNIIPYSDFTDVFRLGGLIPDVPVANIRIIDGGTSGDITLSTVGAPTNIASLSQTATAGPATVNLGTETLRLAAEGVIQVPSGAGALTINNGALTVGGGDDTAGTLTVDTVQAVSVGASINDNGSGVVSLLKKGAGSLALNGSNGFSGGVVQLAGQIQINDPGALGAFNTYDFSGGSFDNTSGGPVDVTNATSFTWNADPVFTGSSDLIFENGSVAMTAARTVTVSGSSLTYGGIVSGNFNLTKAGAGTLILNGANTYTGLTTVSAGKLVIGNNTQLINTLVNTGITVAPSAALQLNGGAGNGIYPKCPITINGAGVASTGGLYMNAGVAHSTQGGLTFATAPSTVRVVGTGSASFGGFDTNQTMITVASAASGTVFDPGINLGGYGYGLNLAVTAGSATATGDLIVNGNLLNIGVDDFNINFSGTGSVVLNGASADFTTNLRNNISVATGSLTFAGNQDFAGGTYTGKLKLSSNAKVTYARTNTAQTFSGVISGAGSFVKSGSSVLTLSAANTYTGNTTVTGGVLSLTLPYLADASDVAISTGATLDLATGASDTVHSLYIDGVLQVPGVWGAVGSEQLTSLP
ncbi:MAG: autotransporter-associated beta strand repeat-containing protein [Luteolibacter sp.]